MMKLIAQDNIDTFFYVETSDVSMQICGPYLWIENALEVVNYLQQEFAFNQSLYPIKIHECDFDGHIILTKMEINETF